MVLVLALLGENMLGSSGACQIPTVPVFFFSKLLPCLRYVRQNVAEDNRFVMLFTMYWAGPR